MTPSSSAQRFPRGVADPSIDRAFLQDRAGRLVAIDLSSGRTLWRSPAAMEPLLARHDRVVAARRTRPTALEIVVLAAADGREMIASPPIALPPWAQDDGTTLTLKADATNGAVVVRWTLDALYRGGAAPSAAILEHARKHSSGAVQMNLFTGVLSEVGAEVSAPALDAGEQQAGPTPAGPDVVETREIGERRFELAAKARDGGTVQLVLRAADRQSGRILWESVIDEGPLQRPRPLRQ
jgi:hypothetical protein